MIDRENKRIVNGHGNILVAASSTQPIMCISHIKFPQTIGDTPKDEYNILDKELFIIDHQDMVKLKNDLLNVDEYNKIIDFIDGWKLDFSEYDPRSIRTYLDGIECIEKSY